LRRQELVRWKEGGQKILSVEKAQYSYEVLNIWEDGFQETLRRILLLQKFKKGFANLK